MSPFKRPSSTLIYPTNNNDINKYKLNKKPIQLTRKIRSVTDSDSSTDASGDFSSESDIRLAYLEARKQYGWKGPQIPKNTYNLRSKQTTWYRPLPTQETSFIENRPQSTPIKKTTVPVDPQIAGPSTRYSNTSLNNSSLGKQLNSMVNNTKKSLISSTSTGTPRIGGAIMGAGANYNPIFERQLGEAAAHPDNPLQKAFHGLFYENLDEMHREHDARLTRIENVTRHQVFLMSKAKWIAQKLEIKKQIDALFEQERTWAKKTITAKFPRNDYLAELDKLKQTTETAISHIPLTTPKTVTNTTQKAKPTRK